MAGKSVRVIGILAEEGCCPQESHLALPNVIRGLVYYEEDRKDTLLHCFLGNAEMDLAMGNYYLLEDGRDISVYTSKKNMQAKADPSRIPEHVFTARIFGTEKNPLLDLPFYCLQCGDGNLHLCRKQTSNI